MNLPSDLALTLAACKAVIEKCIEAGIEPGSAIVCYTWITPDYKARGVAPWHLKDLARRGYLTRVMATRAGHRAYYRLNLPMSG